MEKTVKIILIVLGVILTTVEFGLAKEKLFPLNIDEIDFNKYEIKGKQIIRIAEDIDESGNAKTIKYYEIDNGDVNITIKKELAIETRDAGIYKISGYIPDGYVKEYYESGELKALVHYSSNKRSGEYSAFSKRGNFVACIITFFYQITSLLKSTIFSASFITGIVHKSF